MSGLWYLTSLQLRHRWLRSLLLAATLALPGALPLVVRRLVADAGQTLRQRSASTPLVVGAAGSRFDLVIGALWFRDADLEPIPYGLNRELLDQGLGLPVPLNLRFRAAGRRIVATTPEYFERRGSRLGSGDWPAIAGDCVLGAGAARALELGVGDSLRAGSGRLFDLAAPPALRLRVRGILTGSGTPDDEVVFTDLSTAWILEGLMHGHGDAMPEAATGPRPSPGDAADPSAPLMTEDEVTEDNIGDFHLHGDPKDLPLSAILFFPRGDREGTIAKARLDDRRGSALRMVRPAGVVEELMHQVLRVQSLLDRVAAVLGAGLLLTVGMVLALATRLREAEWRLLDDMGMARRSRLTLQLLEVLAILAGAALIAAVAVPLIGALAGSALSPI